eukprot:5787619-Amphidinium_carterae.2
MEEEEGFPRDDEELSPNFDGDEEMGSAEEGEPEGEDVLTEEEEAHPPPGNRLDAPEAMVTAMKQEAVDRVTMKEENEESPSPERESPGPSRAAPRRDPLDPRGWPLPHPMLTLQSVQHMPRLTCQNLMLRNQFVVSVLTASHPGPAPAVLRPHHG